MNKILTPTAEAIVCVNEMICKNSGSTHICYDIGKVESSISTAFYPGSYPFALGGITKVAGALCYYLVKNHAFMDGNKRTAALSAITFLNKNGWDLKYQFDKKTNQNALAKIIEGCAAGKINRDELIDWFDDHKIKI